MVIDGSEYGVDIHCLKLGEVLADAALEIARLTSRATKLDGSSDPFSDFDDNE